MRNDPREMTAKFTSHCKKCGKVIERGTPIIYWPIGKIAQHEECGREDYRQFLDQVADEGF